MAAVLFAPAVLAASLSLVSQASSAPRPLDGTYWKAIELDGHQVPPQVHEIYLLLQQEGRVSASDGCNRVAGLFKTDGTAVRFKDVAVTKMACIDGADLSAALYKALRRAWRLTATGERLELFDWKDRRLAVFQAVPAARPIQGSADSIASHGRPSLSARRKRHVGDDDPRGRRRAGPHVDLG